MPGLTVDRALWHFFSWRTTFTNAQDFVPSGDTRPIAGFEAPLGSLWEQAREIVGGKILGLLACNRLGRLFAWVDVSLTPSASRASVPELLALGPDDYELVGIDAQTVQACARVELSGVALNAGQYSTIFSLAPGHIFGRYGETKTVEAVSLTSQSQANELAGMIYSRENLPYRFTFDLLVDGLELDIAPAGRVSVVVHPSQNVRGAEYNGSVLPRQVSFTLDAESGILACELQVDAETEGGLAVNGDVPTAEGGTWTPPSTPPPPISPPAPPPGVTIVPPLGACGSGVQVALNFDKKFLSGAQLARSAFAMLPVAICPASSGGANVALNAILTGDARDNLNLYALNTARQRILTGVKGPSYLSYPNWDFAPAVKTSIGGFELEINAGIGGGDIYIKSLLQFDSDFTDGAGVSWTSYGGASVDTVDYKFSPGAGLFVNGNLEADPNNLLDDTNWTIDAWVKNEAIIYSMGAPGSGTGSTPGNRGGLVIAANIAGNGKVRIFAGNLSQSGPTGYYDYITQDNADFSDWVHVEIACQNGYVRAWLNGIESLLENADPGVSEAVSLIGLHLTIPRKMQIMSYNKFAGSTDTTAASTSYFANGRIDERRVSLGIVRHTANFTPPVLPYSATGRTITLGSCYATGLTSQG
jgi:hypothetical protein